MRILIIFTILLAASCDRSLSESKMDPDTIGSPPAASSLDAQPAELIPVTIRSLNFQLNLTTVADMLENLATSEHLRKSPNLVCIEGCFTGADLFDFTRVGQLLTLEELQGFEHGLCTKAEDGSTHCGFPKRYTNKGWHDLIVSLLERLPENELQTLLVEPGHHLDPKRLESLLTLP